MAEKKAETQATPPDDVRYSSLTEKSTYKKNPDPNPLDAKPEPGPSVIQEPGTP